MDKTTYKSAGVDIEKGDALIEGIKASVEKTYSSAVLSPLGGFAGLYDLKAISNDYTSPVLVQSIDGVGTKTIIANMANDYRHIGQDLVSAAVNDILVIGAKPLTLLDYIATAKLSTENVSTLIKSIAASCLKHEIALLGGETAEMPDVYQKGEHDVVGIVTGVVDKHQMIDGQKIKEGNVIIAIDSSGLHTNGYSLARKVFFKDNAFSIDKYFEELGQSLGEALLAPHLNYAPIVDSLLKNNITINGMAHITGGGIKGNLKRVLPFGIGAKIHTQKLNTPAIFNVLQELGNIDKTDMFDAFNMGAGFVLVLDEKSASEALTLIGQNNDFSARIVGETISSEHGVILQ